MLLRRCSPFACTKRFSSLPISHCIASYIAPFATPRYGKVSLRMASTLPRLPMFEAMSQHDPSSCAVVHSESGQAFSYGQLLHDVSRSAHHIQTELANNKKLEGERVAFLVENGYNFVVTFLAIRALRAIAVPLSGGFPAHELQYNVEQSQAALFLSSNEMKEKLDAVVKEGLEQNPVTGKILEVFELSAAAERVELHDVGPDKGGLMLYTSGTTSKPKGVVLPGPVLLAQEKSLLQAWQYSPTDRLLHVLPLHHIHGMVNALLTPLLAGSSIEFLFPFNADAVWRRFAAPFLSSNQDQTLNKPDASKPAPITIFTAVPTVYSRLLDAHPKLESETLKTASRTALQPQYLRLAMAGSAALPTPTKSAWAELSNNNVLLERYGMTEVGMALSCGLAVPDRIDGSVGWPLPSVDIRLVETETHKVIHPGEEKDQDGRERSGEIQLRGPTVFREYFRNPDATKSEFVPAAEDDKDQTPWFKTGDVAIRRVVETAGATSPSTHPSHTWHPRGPAYFISGRASSDIIKTGGEKVSALEIERELLSLPQVAECAVVGVPSQKWGQKVGAVVVLSEEGRTAGKDGGQWSALDMRRAMKERLAPYKCPQVMRCVAELPRNAMGKINKKNLVGEVFRDAISPPPAEDRAGGN